jgi:hypothetical protein
VPKRETQRERKLIAKHGQVAFYQNFKAPTTLLVVGSTGCLYSEFPIVAGRDALGTVSHCLPVAGTTTVH